MSLADKLNNYFTQNDDVAKQMMHGEPDFEYQEWKSKNIVKTELGKWAEANGVTEASSVDSYGGEDQGSTYYSVIRFSDGTDEVFLKFYGWYASYDGANYEGFKQVYPKEVTRIEYV